MSHISNAGRRKGRKTEKKEGKNKAAIKKCYKKEQQGPYQCLSHFSSSAPSGKDHMLKGREHIREIEIKQKHIV